MNSNNRTLLNDTILEALPRSEEKESYATFTIIELEDDGHGFPFKGEYSDKELKDLRLGPVSLKRRVGQGGGQMTIRSTPSGARIRIDFPAHLG